MNRKHFRSKYFSRTAIPMEMLCTEKQQLSASIRASTQPLLLAGTIRIAGLARRVPHIDQAPEQGLFGSVAMACLGFQVSMQEREDIRMLILYGLSDEHELYLSKRRGGAPRGGGVICARAGRYKMT